MREWLSGRASPCQGERREFESRLPLHKDKFLLKLVFFCINKVHWSKVSIALLNNSAFSTQNLA